MIDTSKSSSHEQQNAEVYIVTMVEEWLAARLREMQKWFFRMEYILSRICIRKKIE